MPTILRIDGYRFYFYSHEPNELPRVHVDRAEFSLKAWLEPVALGLERRLSRARDRCDTEAGRGAPGNAPGGVA